MLATLEAIKEALTPLGKPIHLLSAEGTTDTETPSVPYVILAPATGTGLLPEEMPVCGPSADHLEFTLRVTAVSYPATAPMKVQQNVRDLLAPGLGISRIPAAGRFITVAYLRTEVASQVDRDMFITKSNRHPSWAVDSYTVSVQALTTEPVEEPTEPDQTQTPFQAL